MIYKEFSRFHYYLRGEIKPYTPVVFGYITWIELWKNNGL